MYKKCINQFYTLFFLEKKYCYSKNKYYVCTMKEMLQELLKEYSDKFIKNKCECLEMMKNKVEDKLWQEHAKIGAGLKLMIESALIELKKYN